MTTTQPELNTYENSLLCAALDYQEEKPAVWATTSDLYFRYWQHPTAKTVPLDNEQHAVYFKAARRLSSLGYIETSVPANCAGQPRLWQWRLLPAGQAWLARRYDDVLPLTTPVGPRSRLSALAV